ncbi:MAG: peptide ABC transporter substrate-binding protein, partial [Leptospiraceae bacterium]|nr:peptide ABC transporter substrate-binding protein [Leptospiraceae bacterium]
MKKIIFFILSFSLLIKIFPAQRKTIEVLISSDNRIYEQGLYGIQSVIDHELKISYLDIITSENPDVSSFFKTVEESGTPFIITIGPSATKVAKENIKKIPIIFSMVNTPKSLGLDQGNICGVSMDISMGEYFQTLKDINPSIKNVYSFYSTNDGEFSSSEGEYTDLKYKLLFYKKKIANKQDFSKELKQIAGKAEAFLMVNDPLYGKNEFEELSKFSKENKIILMTSFPALVKVGA